MQTSINENTPRFMERMIVSTTTKQPSPSKDSAQASEPVPKQAQETTPNKLDIALSYLEELELDDATFKILDNMASVNLNVDEKEPPYTLYMDSIGMLPKGDLWGIQAAYKNGKTQAASLIMAAILGDTKFGMVAAPDNRTGRVLYFDTEQAEHNTTMVGHRVHKLLGWDVKGNYQNFKVKNLRPFMVDVKIKYIFACIKRYKPVMVVIDGIADLISSINDEQKSIEAVLTLMQISTKYQCSIGGIIHLNKGAIQGKKEDEVARGHLGTALYMKVVDMFTSTKNDDGTFTLSHVMSRNVENKETFSWRIDKETKSLVRIDKTAEAISEETRKQLQEPWRMAFAVIGKEEATHTELIEGYKKATHLSLATAKRHLSKAVETDLLTHENNLYKLI